jgi:hypothetical protein
MKFKRQFLFMLFDNGEWASALGTVDSGVLEEIRSKMEWPVLTVTDLGVDESVYIQTDNYVLTTLEQFDILAAR